MTTFMTHIYDTLNSTPYITPYNTPYILRPIARFITNRYHILPSPGPYGHSVDR